MKPNPYHVSTEPMPIEEAYTTTADKILPVEYRRHWEDGFMYEVRRPTTPIVMVVTVRGVKYYKEGDQALCDAIEAEGTVTPSDGWNKFPYPKYGSPAWQDEQIRNHSQWRR